LLASALIADDSRQVHAASTVPCAGSSSTSADDSIV